MSSFSLLRHGLTRLSCIITHQLTTLTSEAAVSPANATRLTQSLFSLRSFTSTPAIHQNQEESNTTDNKGSAGGGITSWVKSKIPSALGGNREEISQLENLSMDDFGEGLKQARRMGALTGFAGGTSSASDPAAQGTLRLFESIIAAMTTDEKQNAATQFSSNSRERIAAEVGCSVAQVDDCVARYRWMRSMTVRMAELKKEGKPMPKSIDELEAMLGTWKQHKQVHASAPGDRGSGSGGLEVPMGAVSRLKKGVACPLAGLKTVGKNTKCPLTKKSYKACCGRK
jgi:hypothetical protein